MTPTTDPMTFAVSCPTCNTPIEGYQHDNGIKLTNPYDGPNGGPGTRLGTFDEIGDAHRYDSRIEQAPEHGMVTLDPCGHSFRGYEGGTDLLGRIFQAQVAWQNAEADVTIAEHADLLAAAEANGGGPVAEKWQAAVRSGSADARGLLVALRALADR